MLDSISSSSLEKYQLALRGVGYRRYNKSAYEMLDTPLDLTDMKSQDERTGELAFPISAHVDDYGGVEKNYHLEYSSFYNTIINDLNK